MRAIVIAASEECVEAAMAPLMDRPFLQHVVETLTRLGTSRIDLVLDHRAGAIEAAMGDGTRWGLTIRHHLVGGSGSLARVLRVIAGDCDDEPLLLAHADHLVDAEAPGPERRLPIHYAEDGPGGRRAGWSWVDRDGLARFADGDAQDWPGVVAEFEARATLDYSSEAARLRSQEHALRHQFPGLLRSGREVEPGIAIARNVELHPSARVVAPVHIGEDCRIGAGVRLGPNVSVGEGSVIDAGARVEDAIIGPGTYVGRGVELRSARVDRDRLARAGRGPAVSVIDPTILGGVPGASARDVARGLIHRAGAVLAIAILLPAGSLMALVDLARGRSVRLHHRKIIRMPSVASPRGWMTFRLWTIGEPADDPAPGWSDLVRRVLPGLWSVAAGDLRWAGATPRTAEELQAIDEAGRAVILSQRSGLITEAIARLDPGASAAERAMADRCRAARGNLIDDARLIGAYLRRCAGPVHRPVAWAERNSVEEALCE